MKYCMVLKYDGTGINGWQSQKNALAIQDILEGAVFRITGEKKRVVGASRTDSGVHAVAQVATFNLKEERECADLQYKLNAVLPPAISVRKLFLIEDSFRPQKDAINKTYKYFILNSRIRNPFIERYSWHIPYPLNRDNMREAARQLVGVHNFAAFQNSGTDQRTTIRNIQSIDIQEIGDIIGFTITAEGFLKQMVRNIISNVIDVARGRREVSHIKLLLESRDRRNGGKTAPPQGLFLWNIRYLNWESGEKSDVIFSTIEI